MAWLNRKTKKKVGMGAEIGEYLKKIYIDCRNREIIIEPVIYP